MKYGKEFQHILEDSSFPPEWKESAIEYGRLKKLIKNVVQELTSMGLSPEVLHKLLITAEVDASNLQHPISSIPKEDDDEVLEFEYESPETTPPTIQSGCNPSSSTSQTHPHPQPQEVVLDPLPESHNLTIPPFASSSKILSPTPVHQTQNPHHRKFRLRLLSDSSQSSTSPNVFSLADLPQRPLSVAEFLEAQERLREEKTPSPSEAQRGRTVIRRAVMDGSKGGVKAEYVLTGDPSNPIPQLRLHVQASPSPSQSSLSPSPSSTPSPMTTPSEDTDNDTEDEEDPIPSSSSTAATPRPFDRIRSPIIPSSPTLQKMKSALSPIFAIASGRDLRDAMGDLTIGDSISNSMTVSSILSPDIETESIPEISASTSATHERDFVIPLSSDLEFFHLLTSALTSLSTFHAKQQTLFKDAVENVCQIISSTISPSTSSSVQVIPVPPTSTPSLPRSSEYFNTDSIPIVSNYHGGKTSKKDLYIWREIFSLWIESEIFESSSERTRGERSLEDAEARLKEFANKVIKRGLGDKRSIKGKKSRNAWEEFLKLNVWLLDLKRFQGANVMAARKILKKHDKRTALTALEGFPSFVQSTLSTHVDEAGNVSTWAFYNTSLPHILLASLTNTLLPILPSLDDYACLICTSIAFKPIRLGCGHLFCVRCLVKMQRAGKEECPLCRSKVILLADKNSLDLTVMNFMKSWFPKEVKAKQKENELEVAHEQANEAGIDTRCVIM
uniref:RING-14 protein n=1 Tax=Kwoniella bestiolae CBS 10118 TaxID=1296100 RepID=A0A1B9FYY2_9TREE|nr:hypothetical protein I302_06965 [Kwoniella bestiolae CBS 10118]OCF23979.1 hypothetical protein I302_06965 [Kwoniella bestiolae CBS 10118]